MNSSEALVLRLVKVQTDFRREDMTLDNLKFLKGILDGTGVPPISFHNAFGNLMRLDKNILITSKLRQIFN